jgi:hypothetical protein
MPGVPRFRRREPPAHDGPQNTAHTGGLPRLVQSPVTS